MYHALFRGSDIADIDQEDRPYAVSEADFMAQLDLLADKHVGLFAPGQIPDIVITFDDGHRSNLEIAAPILRERGMPAYFFITSDFVGKRAGFMEASEIRQLADMPGMCIGSHGVSHRFFDDLDERESHHELVTSRQQLASWTGRDCQSISFPGGRYNEQTLRQLQAAGYCQWFGSRTDVVSAMQSFDWTGSDSSVGDRLLVPQLQHWPLERVAVRRTTTLDEFILMTGPDKAFFRHHRRRSQAKSLLRRCIGNRLYHGLYKSLSAR